MGVAMQIQVSSAPASVSRNQTAKPYPRAETSSVRLRPLLRHTSQIWNGDVARKATVHPSKTARVTLRHRAARVIIPEPTPPGASQLRYRGPRLPVARVSRASHAEYALHG